MPEIGSSGLMSGDGKRGVGHRPQATAPILDSTKPVFSRDEISQRGEPDFVSQSVMLRWTPWLRQQMQFNC